MLGGVFIFLRDVVRTFCIFSFLSCLDTLFLCIVITNLVFLLRYIYIYIYLMRLLLHFFHLSSCVVSFLSLCTCFLYLVCNLLFLFHTKMPWWVLFKVFQKYWLSKSFLPLTLFLQRFLRVCVRIDFIVFNKWIWVECFMTSPYVHLFVVVLSWIVKGGDC